MLVDGGLRCDPGDPSSAARSARQGARYGYHRLFTAELAHDPFLPIALAAGAADIGLGTDIAVAFARTPMTVATTARDLQALTGGRFVLGLGSQVKAHITRRFSMPWSQPAARMREFILAVRAIWQGWDEGTAPNFAGEFYTHTLSAPMFEPGPAAHPAPPIQLAAVGPLMTEVAGEVADGLLCHAFTSASYLAEVTLPALHRGIVRAGRERTDLEVSAPIFVATGPAGADLAPAVDRLRAHIAFYASTPAYRGVLDHHGLSDLGTELHTLSRAQRWDEMSRLVDDDVVNIFGVVADAASLAKEVHARYGHVLTAVRLNLPDDDPQTWAPVIAELAGMTA